MLSASVCSGIGMGCRSIFCNMYFIGNRGRVSMGADLIFPPRPRPCMASPGEAMVPVVPASGCLFCFFLSPFEAAALPRKGELTSGPVNQICYVPEFMIIIACHIIAFTYSMLAVRHADMIAVHGLRRQRRSRQQARTGPDTAPGPAAFFRFFSCSPVLFCPMFILIYME